MDRPSSVGSPSWPNKSIRTARRARRPGSTVTSEATRLPTRTWKVAWRTRAGIERATPASGRDIRAPVVGCKTVTSPPVTCGGTTCSTGTTVDGGSVVAVGWGGMVGRAVGDGADVGGGLGVLWGSGIDVGTAVAVGVGVGAA